MKVALLNRDSDFPLNEDLELVENHSELAQDLGADILFDSMAEGDSYIKDVVNRVVFSSFENAAETIAYRQAILQDVIKNLPAAKEMYALGLSLNERKQKDWLGIYGKSSGSVVSGSAVWLKAQFDILKQLLVIVSKSANSFKSEGLKAFCARLQKDFTDQYIAAVLENLGSLEFRSGVMLSVQLGPGNQGVDYTLCEPGVQKKSWINKVVPGSLSGNTISITNEDTHGARVLSELQERGLHTVANVLAQSADHISNFFAVLRTELAFYIGCANLHQKLSKKAVPIVYPTPAANGTSQWQCTDLRDVCLTLLATGEVVGNTLDGRNKSAFVVTGANNGGKSTFIRSVGLAQMMMQSGMFVTATAFTSEIHDRLYTHFRREEDASLKSGKFDEELARMNTIVDSLTPNSMVLMNESFAATNEREGSEIARYVFDALVNAGAKTFFVTHLHEFSQQLADRRLDNVCFLRAERRADGSRSYRLSTAEPLKTSFALDLYDGIFGAAEVSSGKR